MRLWHSTPRSHPAPLIANGRAFYLAKIPDLIGIRPQIQKLGAPTPQSGRQPTRHKYRSIKENP